MQTLRAFVISVDSCNVNRKSGRYTRRMGGDSSFCRLPFWPLFTCCWPYLQPGSVVVVIWLLRFPTFWLLLMSGAWHSADEKWESAKVGKWVVVLSLSCGRTVLFHSSLMKVNY